MTTNDQVRSLMSQYVQHAMQPWYWKLAMLIRGAREVRRVGNYDFVVYCKGDKAYVTSCESNPA